MSDAEAFAIKLLEAIAANTAAINRLAAAHEAKAKPRKASKCPPGCACEVCMPAETP